MLSLSSIPGLLAELVLASSIAYAQAPTQAQTTACGESLRWPGYQKIFNYKYDDTSIFDLTATYNVSACTSPVIVPTFEIILNDFVDGRVFRCTLQQPAADRNTIYSQCTRKTRGAMARDARDYGESDYRMTILMGTSESNAGTAYPFQVTTFDETPAPVASGAIARKRATLEEQHRFDCPMGQTSCWTGERQDYACMDTSSDVTACGRCPFGPGADDVDADCTAIEGADDVQCRNSKCVVNVCQRGFKLSLDKTKCLDARKRSTPVRPLHK